MPGQESTLCFKLLGPGRIRNPFPVVRRILKESGRPEAATVVVTPVVSKRGAQAT